MTDSEINIAIAEACGWRNIAFERPRNFDTPEWCGVIHGGHKPIPMFTEDLNAMHEAEVTCVVPYLGKAIQFRNELRDVACGGHKYEISDSYIWHATARQRAEAFLRTLSKWKD